MKESPEKSPAKRSRAKTIAKIVVAAVALLFAYTLLVPAVTSDGVVGRTIAVTVRSSEGALIPNASVTLIQGLGARLESVLNKEDFLEQLKSSHHSFVSYEYGMGTLSAMFGAGWHNGLFGNSGGFLVSGVLIASHPDYLELRAPLANFTQEKKFSLSHHDLNITVYLERKKDPENPPKSP
ncbi:hypothetical protein BH09VER1_BH09VER1_48910 [soil metagenome]